MGMETTEILKKVRRVEIKTRRLTNQLFSGEYHSSFKGKGMSFSEVRKYEPGDDVRDIDWNVTAKLNEPYLKVFEEERELTMMLVVDISSSGHFGSRNLEKRELITEFCAVLAFSAMQNNDKVGLLLFSDQIEKFIPPKKGRSHILRIIRELIEFEPKQEKTNISQALSFLFGVMKKQNITFLISDFIDTNYQKEVQIASKKYDFTGVRVWDTLEEKMPNLGFIEWFDLETKKGKWMNTSSKKNRIKYEAQFQKNKTYFEEVFTKSGASFLDISTQDSYVKKLLMFFKNR